MISKKIHIFGGPLYTSMLYVVLISCNFVVRYSEYCICMVTVTSRNGPIRNSVLPNHMSDLANFIGIESRLVVLHSDSDGY